MSLQNKATIASFGGKLLKLAHNASSTKCEMAFNLFLPPQATVNPLKKVPLLIYLAGLTCTGDNCAEKGFFQNAASKEGIAVLYPDTSPRESPFDLVINVPIDNSLADLLCCIPLGGLKIENEDKDWDFGTGAGFYVDATETPWSEGYSMYTYITRELPEVVFDNFEQIDRERVSITGHSMGGHGALTLVSQLASHLTSPHEA